MFIFNESNNAKKLSKKIKKTLPTFYFKIRTKLPVGIIQNTYCIY